MKFSSLLFLFLSIASAVAQLPKYLITAPNIVHLGVEETVTVQLQGATSPTHVKLFFFHQIANRVVSDVKTLTLSGDNDHQGLVKLKVDPTSYREAEQTAKSKTITVQLTAESDIFPLVANTNKRFIKETISLSTRKGYIFIQTDKPIYNPGEYVNYRIFTLDHYLRPTEENIQVNIYNSKGLRIVNNAMHANKIYQRSLLIPDVELAGHWRIEASYLKHPMSNSSVEFEVKEYALPVFEVKIEPFKKYLLLKDESFHFNVRARYTYGKGVNGVTYVRFALINPSGDRVYLNGLENNTRMQDGFANFALATRDLLAKAADEQVEDFDDFHLYIAVTTLETASGDLEEAEMFVKIVNSPYRIDMSKTKEYFTPGGTFSILASTSFPEGSPAPNLRMKAVVTVSVAGDRKESEELEGRCNENGQAVLTYRVPLDAVSMDIKMFSEGEEQGVNISDAHMIVSAARDVGQSALSVEIQHTTLVPGQEMTVILRDIVPAGTPRPSHIYFMVLTKGRVVRLNRVPRIDITTVRLPFLVDLVPSFRFVAYYYTEANDIAADSVWVDAKDVCEGQIEIQPFKEHKPADLVTVEIRSNKADKVALAAVDTAVYILNKRNKLTPQKMFDYMNSYDLACTMGGGIDSESVLKDAGLVFLTNVNIPNKQIRKEESCNPRTVRKKRNINQQEELNKIVARNSKSSVERTCCSHGAKPNPQGLSCDQRHAKTAHMHVKCRSVFLRCCKDVTKLKEDIQKRRRTQSLARTDVEGKEEFFSDLDVQLRSHFPQTWMWDIIDVGPSGSVSHQVAVPDSITTWEVQAIGISSQTGFCIAEPKPLTVFQDFFVSLKLPYSVKRNEQLEVKAVVYNYQAKSLEVKVRMHPAEGLCTAGADRNTEVVLIPGNSAVPVYFTAVPLTTGQIPIQVDANSITRRDSIKKELKVVGEGEVVSLEREFNIDAKSDRPFLVEIPTPPNLVPGQQSDAYISIKGGVMGESVVNCLDLKGVDQLIALPQGCAEQAMVTLSPAIHALKYLDATGGWIDLRAERRDEALAMIQDGYIRVLTFKKTDGSYGAFLTRPSSIWLTAFISKELSRIKGVITVDESYIQESISYIVSKQLESGAFNDPNPLYDRTMQGGVGGFESDVSLAAFVMLAMHHAYPLYPEFSDDSSKLLLAMRMSQNYIDSKMESLQRPFAVAIAAYALSLTSPGSESAAQAKTKLRSMAKCDEEEDTCHWEANEALRLIDEKKVSAVPQANAISVETTAYALLQAVTEQDMQYAERIARWLTQQRKYGGGFRSTQDTVVALEALTTFSIQADDTADLNLSVEMCDNVGRKQTVHVTKRNALNSPAFQATSGSSIEVKVTGVGSGTLTMLQNYRSLEKTGQYCDLFHLSVTLEGEVTYKKTETYGDDLGDYYNYDTTVEQEPSEEPMSRQELFDLRTRRKRQAPQLEQKEDSLFYKVCVGLKSGTLKGMVVVDISLLSGLQPNMQDLEDNVKGTERYIDHYDVAPNKVFLYFAEITTETDCVTFRAKQINPIGLVQPAAAVIYEYYNPDRKCGVFYSAPQKSNMISKLCQGNVCTCAEGGCPKLKVTFSGNMTAMTRSTFACFTPTVDYVYAIRILNSTDDGIFDRYIASLTQVLQADRTDNTQPGGVRVMITRKACGDFKLKTDGEYLIMGRSKTISKTIDFQGKPIYVLDNEVWVEEIPEARKCKASKNRQACKLLNDFMAQHELSNCSF